MMRSRTPPNANEWDYYYPGIDIPCDDCGYYTCRCWIYMFGNSGTCKEEQGYYSYVDPQFDNLYELYKNVAAHNTTFTEFLMRTIFSEDFTTKFGDIFKLK